MWNQPLDLTDTRHAIAMGVVALLSIALGTLVTHAVIPAIVAWQLGLPT